MIIPNRHKNLCLSFLIIFLLFFLFFLVLLFVLYRKFSVKNNKQPFKNIWEPYKITMRDLCRKVQSVLKDQKIEIVPTGNTLLGIVRHKGVIPWSDTIELCVSDEDYIAIKKFWEKPSGNVSMVTLPDRYRFFSVKGEKIDGKEWTWPFIDIFNYSVKGDDVSLPSPNENKVINLQVKTKDFLPFRTNLFEMIPMNLPNNPDKILDILYGKDWLSVCKSASYSTKTDTKFSNILSVKCDQLQPIGESLFKNTWVINLDKRPERWDKTLERLGVFGIQPKRFSAIDAGSDDFEEFYMNIPLPKRAKGEVACYLSHIALWKHIYKLGIPYALIFEDDIIFGKNVSKQDILDAANDSIGFDIVFLGHCGGVASIIHGFQDFRFDSPNTILGTAMCCHAYIISRKCIEDLLKKRLDFAVPIDVITKNYCNENTCFLSKHKEYQNTGCFGSGLIHQDRNMTSDLEIDRGIILF